MDNYTPDPFWNNSNNSDEGNNNNDYSNEPNQGYTDSQRYEQGNDNSYANNGYGSYNNEYDNNSYNNSYNNGYSNNNNYNDNYDNNYNGGYENGNSWNGNNNGWNNNNWNNNNGWDNNNNGYNNAPQNCPHFTGMLVFCIVSIVFLSRLFGVIALIMVFKANNSFRAGMYDKYESSMNACKVLLAISVVIGIISIILNVLYLMVYF